MTLILYYSWSKKSVIDPTRFIAFFQHWISPTFGPQLFFRNLEETRRWSRYSNINSLSVGYDGDGLEAKSLPLLIINSVDVFTRGADRRRRRRYGRERRKLGGTTSGSSSVGRQIIFLTARYSVRPRVFAEPETRWIF